MAISLAIVGCAGLGPRNAYKPVADLIGPDKAMKCFANAQYFQEKGKNENTDFGSQYIKPYTTQKWQTAKLMQQFYFNVLQNYPEQVRNKLFDTYRQSTYYTKEIADDCQKGFDGAPQQLKDASYNESPFFTDQQKVSFVCQSNNITNAEDAIIYFRAGNPQKTFGTCVSKSETMRIRDFLVIYESSRTRDRWVGSYRAGNALVFTPISQFDKYYNVSYFPDLKK